MKKNLPLILSRYDKLMARVLRLILVLAGRSGAVLNFLRGGEIGIETESMISGKAGTGQNLTEQKNPGPAFPIFGREIDNNLRLYYI